MGAICGGRWISGIPAIVVTMIQNIFCAQAGAGIRLNFWKNFGESRYPGALSPVLTAPGSPRMGQL